jgi:hypothetical protein
MIAKMLLDNDTNYSTREIARTVGTTEGNVFKEKSRLKASGILTDQRLSILSHSVGEETLTLARAEGRTLVTRSLDGPLTDIPPLSQEDLKKMYSEFKNGRTPVEVIAENGFNPILVEHEYSRFCRMNSLNLGSLVHELGNVFQLGPEVSEPLFQKIKQGGALSNNDIKKMIEDVSNISYTKGELSVIERMRNGDSVGTFKPFVCSICNGTIRGAMIEHESEIGRKLVQSIGTGAVHDNCIYGFTSKT